MALIFNIHVSILHSRMEWLNENIVHILNVARSLLFQLNVSLHFWGEYVLTAVYLINRLPSPLLFNQSPYEKLYQKPHSLQHIRVFGCECYATVVQPKQKFFPRATRCIFLGYLHNQKGYKLLDLISNQFIVSRDVTFNENIFPLMISELNHSLNTDSASSSLHPPLLPNLAIDSTTLPNINF